MVPPPVFFTVNDWLPALAPCGAVGDSVEVLTDNAGPAASSSTIVTVSTDGVPMAAPETEIKFTVNVSLPSTIGSFTIGTMNVLSALSAPHGVHEIG